MDMNTKQDPVPEPDYPSNRKLGRHKRIDSPFYNGIDFTLHNASGGHIIVSNVYDITTDSTKQELYIIPEDKELGDEIGKILMLEALKRGR
jgi:hypothetical protein